MDASCSLALAYVFTDKTPVERSVRHEEWCCLLARAPVDSHRVCTPLLALYCSYKVRRLFCVSRKRKLWLIVCLLPLLVLVVLVLFCRATTSSSSVDCLYKVSTCSLSFVCLRLVVAACMLLPAVLFNYCRLLYLISDSFTTAARSLVENWK